MSLVRSRIVGGSVSAVLSVLVAGGAAELWLRRSPPAVPAVALAQRFPVECVEASVTRGYAARPGVCGYDAEGTVRVVTPGDPSREVLLLGDSLATHRWVPRTAEALGASLAPAGLVFRNAGMSGYDSCQEAATWEERRSDPELLVVQTCPNDAAVTSTMVRLPGGWVRAYDDGGAITLPAVVLDSRVLLRLGVWLGDRWGREPGARRGPGDALACLDAVHESATDAGVPVVFLFFPGFDGGPQRGFEVAQAEWFASRPYDMIDVRALLSARDPALLVSPDGVHPDRPEQATALAELLAPELRARLGQR